jgi:hypothetical protein
MANKLKVRIYRWENGQLATEDHVFFNHLKAMEFANTIKDCNVKIYNMRDQLFHEIINTVEVQETYA